MKPFAGLLMLPEPFLSHLTFRTADCLLLALLALCPDYILLLSFGRWASHRQSSHRHQHVRTPELTIALFVEILGLHSSLSETIKGKL